MGEVHPIGSEPSPEENVSAPLSKHIYLNYNIHQCLADMSILCTIYYYAILYFKLQLGIFWGKKLVCLR